MLASGRNEAAGTRSKGVGQMWWTSAYGTGAYQGSGIITINHGVDPSEPWILKITNSAYIPE